MSAARAEVLALAVLVAFAGCLALAETQPLWAEILLGVLALAYLAAFPTTALRLTLLTLSCDRVLTAKAGPATIRLAHICLLVLFSRLVATRVARREPIRVARPILAPLAFYFAAALLGMALFLEVGGAAKSIGYLAWAAFDAVALVTVILEATPDTKGLQSVLRWWIAGAILNATFGLAQLAMGVAHMTVPLADQKLGEFPRINGFNYEPAYFALYLESVAAVLIGRWLSDRRKRADAILGVALLVPAALSMSRSGWLGLIVITLVSSCWLTAGLRGRELVIGSMGIATVLCLGLIVLPGRFLARAPVMAAAALNPHEQSSSSPRLGMMGQAVEVFRASPVLGVGLGGYAGFIGAHPELEVLHLPKTEATRIVTTNLWLEILAETGLVGLFGVLWLVLATLRALWRAARSRAPVSNWAGGFFLSIALVFVVLYQFNQTLWRLDVWTLLALGWSVVAMCERSGAKDGAQLAIEAGPRVGS
ncbi:MAG: O-antigen ligase family protein [Deltaproteobacteria bacterium]|nr:O-antigen ligase family protein [Deltaproteobacteria bacterium]